MELRLLAHSLPSFKGCAVCGCYESRRASLLPLVLGMGRCWGLALARIVWLFVVQQLLLEVSRMEKEHRGSPGHPPAFRYKAWGTVQKLG